MGKQLFLQTPEGLAKQAEMLTHAVDKLTELGFVVSNDDTAVYFIYKGSKVTHYAYTGWHTGKSIVDGRGLKNLLKQLK